MRSFESGFSSRDDILHLDDGMISAVAYYRIWGEDNPERALSPEPQALSPKPYYFRTISTVAHSGIGCSWQILIRVLLETRSQEERPISNLSANSALPFINLVSILIFSSHCLTRLHSSPFVSFNRFAHFAHTVAHLKHSTPPGPHQQSR